MHRCQDVWLLVTAHPDDEAMFFIPTLRTLLGSRDEGPPLVRVLCLSNGDYRDPSDGPVRARELQKACAVIGVQNGKDGAGAVTVLDDVRMKDGPNEVWDPDVVAGAVMEQISKKIAPAVSADAATSGKQHDYILSGPDADATHPWVFSQKNGAQTKPTEKSMQSVNLNILTFDRGGVSGHPNHVDTYKGVQHLLEEKCCIARGKGSEPKATLQLRQETKDTVDKMQMNVSVYTLRTIANPLHKYFLWAFVDIIPHLFIRLFQTLCYLAYFLLGGLLWRGKGPQIQAFSGTIAAPDDKTLHCRIVEPLLVWRAMAAHHSQFVWYRRLSVMFSRYTFINDLQKLATIEVPMYEDIEDDDVATLPSVVTIEDEEPASTFLLTTTQMNALRKAVLPPNLHHRPWKRLYSLPRDGDSFVAFQKKMEDWNRKPGDTSSTILVVKTSAGALIGGFADVPLIPTADVVGSAARSCLFRICEGKDGKTDIDVYGKYSADSKRIVSSASRRLVAFGGGASTGESDEGFGLCLEDRFARGTTARCAAFGNEPLVSGKDGVFEVLDVEVWGFSSVNFDYL